MIESSDFHPLNALTEIRALLEIVLSSRAREHGNLRMGTKRGEGLANAIHVLQAREIRG